MCHSDRPEVDDTPHVRPEPHRRATVGLVLADQDRMRNGQQSDQSSVLEELEDLRLISQTSDIDNKHQRRPLTQRPMTVRLVATLRGSRPGVQSTSLIMTSLMTS